MAAARKYSFDTVFAPDGGVLPSSGHRSHYSAEEFEGARARAFEEGRAQAAASAETHAADAAEALARSAAAIAQTLEQECAQLRAEAAALALAAARQAAGAALAAFGEDRIVTAVEQAMDLLAHGPRLVVRVPTNSFNALRGRLEAAAQKTAYAGAVLVREDSTLAAGDVTLDWAEGAIRLERAELFARIEDVMNRSLETSAAAGDVMA